MSSYSSGGGGAAIPALLRALTGTGGSDKWYLPGWNYFGTTEVTAFGDNWIAYIPIYVQRAHTFTAIAVFGGSTDWGASALARLGIYTAKFDANDLLVPDALVGDYGTVNLDVVGLHEIVINEALSAETFYFLAVVTDVKGGPAGTLDAPTASAAFSAPITGWQNVNPGAAPNFVLGQFLAAVIDNGLPTSPAPDTGFGIERARAFLRD